MLDNPTARAEAARKIVEESRGPNPLDERDGLLEDMARASVRITIPVRSVTELKRHVRMIIAEFEAIGASLDRGSEKDRTLLLGAGTRIKVLSQRLNAYRTPRRWD